MLFSRIKAPDDFFCRLRVVYSREPSPLASLEKRLTLTIFKPFLIKSAAPVAHGFVSVWRFPKADRHLAAVFDSLYLAIVGYRSLTQANATEKAIDLERIGRERAKTQAAKRLLAEEAERARQAEAARHCVRTRDNARRAELKRMHLRGELSLRKLLAANRDPKPLE